MKRLRAGQSDEVLINELAISFSTLSLVTFDFFGDYPKSSQLHVNYFQVSFSGSNHPPNIYSPDDLPKTAARDVSQGSNVMSMDFHPQQQTVLLGLLLRFLFYLLI